jgi:1-deoxy-D-xylulose-5-phosphate synthase
VKPLDRERIIALAKRCRVVVTIEEHSVAGGFGGAVLELLAEEGIHTPVRTLGVSDQLIEHGESTATIGLAPTDIRDAVTGLLDSLRGTDSVEGADGAST